MDDNRFDSLTRALGAGRSRRSVVKGLGAAALGAVGLGRLGAAEAAKGGKGGGGGGADNCNVYCQQGPGRGAGHAACVQACHQCGGVANLFCEANCVCCPSGNPCGGYNGVAICCAAGETCSIDINTGGPSCGAPSGCPAGTTDCGGGCLDLSSDVNNCNSCGNVCSGDDCNAPICSGGNCTTAPTNGGGSCNGGSGTCSNGTCQLPDPCTGIDCSNTGNECVIGYCSSGTCYFKPNTGAPCNNLTGTCDESGTCIANSGGCSLGTTDCNGTCTSLNADPNNCGVCGNACSGAGQCATVACNSGVCATTPTNEGGTCNGGTGVCTGGTCVATGACSPGTTSCDGTCTDLNNDPGNCGACGAACGAIDCNNAGCDSGSCYYTSDPAAEGQSCNGGTGTCDNVGNCVRTAGGPGTCAADSDYCATGNFVSCNGSGACHCYGTVSGAPFCGTGGGVCAECNADADCVAAGFGVGAACLDLGVNCSSCAGSGTPTHVCMAACTA